jgi:hypothetical protein
MPHETSYLAHAKWKTLVNAKSIPGRLAPSIKYAFILEPKLNLNNTDFTTDGDVAKPAMPSENVASKDRKLQKSASPLQDVELTEPLNSDDQLAPVLMEKLGYFLLGDRKDANQTFYFNVFISSGKNLELAISEDNASLIGQGTKFYFSYNLFGCNIQTESFKNLHDTSSEFLAERASARVLTNSRTMEKFFKEVLSPLEIDLCSNDNVVACCHLDISTFLDFSYQDLDKIQLIEYEGLAIMHPPKTSPENSSFVQNRDRSVTLSSEVHSKNIAHVSFRLSVGKHKDDGLYENEP